MHYVMFILGIVSLLVGLLLLLLQEADAEKTKGVAAMIVGIVLLVLGSDLGERVQNLKVSGTSVEMSFSQEPVALTAAQVDGAQKAQQIRLAPQSASNTRALSTGALNTRASSMGAPSIGTPNSGVSRFILKRSPEAERRYQEQTETLHQALQAQGFTPAPNPFMDLTPGTVVKLAPDGKLAVQLRRQDAFPLLKVQSLAFDFLRFTSSGGTKPGFKQIGVFSCDQGFREDIDSVRSAAASLAAEVAMNGDPSLKVIRSVLGCYGTELLSLNPTSASPSPEKRYILGFQLTTAGR